MNNFKVISENEEKEDCPSIHRHLSEWQLQHTHNVTNKK